MGAAHPAGKHFNTKHQQSSPKLTPENPKKNHHQKRAHQESPRKNQGSGVAHPAGKYFTNTKHQRIFTNNQHQESPPGILIKSRQTLQKLDTSNHHQESSPKISTRIEPSSRILTNNSTRNHQQESPPRVTTSHHQELPPTNINHQSALTNS